MVLMQVCASDPLFLFITFHLGVLLFLSHPEETKENFSLKPKTSFTFSYTTGEVGGREVGVAFPSSFSCK